MSVQQQGALKQSLALPETILVLAPHPDDEVLLAGGVIARAVAQGKHVCVVVVTNGDYLSSTQEKGCARLKESLAALCLLGVQKKDIYFLGYPDTGMEPEASFLHTLYHAQDATQVYPSSCSAQTYALPHHADYAFARTGAHMPYTQASFTQDLHALLQCVRPQLVITTSVFDLHADHSALAHFVRDELRVLHEKEKSFCPALWEGLVHSPAGDDVWPVPEQGMSAFTMPPKLQEMTALRWGARISVPVPEEMRTEQAKDSKKYKAIQAYKSAFHSGEESVWAYLLAFTKADECFWPIAWNTL